MIVITIPLRFTEIYMIKISIITVVYNNKLITDAIKSVLNQNYKNVEYIVIDGGSNDGTLEIVKAYGKSINKLVSEPDHGIYDAINKGIKIATGDVIGILNSDDFFSNNNVLTNITQEFDTDENIEALYADVAFVDRFDTNNVLRYYSSKRFRPWMFRFGFQPAHPTFYVRKDVFGKLGYYRTDLGIAGDFELLIRFLQKGKLRYKYINKQLVTMRIGGVSTSGLSSIKKLNSEIKLALKLNGIYSNNLFIYSKYFIKWWGFIFKK